MIAQHASQDPLSPTKKSQSYGNKKIPAPKRWSECGAGEDIDEGDDVEDDIDARLKSIAMASLTINSIGGGDRRGRNTLSLSKKNQSIEGAVGRWDGSDAGVEAGLRAVDIFLDEGDVDRKRRQNRRVTVGDSLMLSAVLPDSSDDEGEDEDQMGKVTAKSPGNVTDGEEQKSKSVALSIFHSAAAKLIRGNSSEAFKGSVASLDSDGSEGDRDFLQLCSTLGPAQDLSDAAEKALEETNEGGGAGVGRKGEQLTKTGSGRMLSHDDIGQNSTSLAGIKLEDLVPTRRISRENSARSGDLAISVEIETVVNHTIPRQSIEVTIEDGGSPMKDVLQQSGFDVDIEGDNEERGAILDLEAKSPVGSAKMPTSLSSNTLGSYVTAPSRDPSPSPPLSGDVIDEEGSGESSLRSQLELMKSEQVSYSGGTGKTTQGTSSSTLFSSTRSVSENVPPAPSENTPKNSGIGGKTYQTKTSFEAIREEEKEFRNSKNSDSREQESRDSFNANDADDYGGNVSSGYGLYKRKKSSRIQKIRRGLRNSLRGTNSRNVNGNNSTEYQNIEGVSEGGSAISAEQQERVSRHLQRSGSSRSVTSAISSFSAITGNSDASSNASGRVWNRFKLKGSRPKMPKAQSMFTVVGNRSNKGGSESDVSLSNSVHCNSLSNSVHRNRQLLVTNRSDWTASNVSNLSSDDERSTFTRNSALTTESGKFSDFYNHGDHAKAVSSLISSKASSGRSLGVALETVKEPANEGGHNGSSGGISAEQKHDEDYHHKREKELSAYHEYHDSQSHDSIESTNSFYRYPSHEHELVHMRPNQLFPNSPGWQCDECCMETFDLNTWAYISTEKNYLVCEDCFKSNGYSVGG